MNLKPGKYLKSETNGAIFIYDEQNARLPQMRVLHIAEDGPVVRDEVRIEVTPTNSELRREDLVALYVAKFNRRPHARMGMEKLRAAVEAIDGNDSSSVDR